MLTYNTILEEIKDVPLDKLEDLHAYINTLTTTENKSEILKKKILSFSNTFKDMDEAEFKNFTKQTTSIRKSLFDRKIKI